MIYKKDSKRFERDFDWLVLSAVSLYDSDRALSDRYSEIAYSILKSKRARLGHDKKVLICKDCTKILIPNKTAVVRLERGFLVYRCMNCGRVRKTRYDKRIRRKSD